MANAADPKQVNYGRRKELRRERAYLGSLRDVMGTPSGRLVVEALLTRVGVWKSTFNRDPMTMAYDEGRRSVGVELLKELDALGSALYDQLVAERRARLEADRREDDAVITANQED